MLWSNHAFKLPPPIPSEHFVNPRLVWQSARRMPSQFVNFSYYRFKYCQRVLSTLSTWAGFPYSSRGFVQFLSKHTVAVESVDADQQYRMHNVNRLGCVVSY
jgi:hypothetical protein